MGKRPYARLAAKCVGLLLLVAMVPQTFRGHVLRVHAEGASIVVSPDANLPHALESFVGSGFQPLLPVDFSIGSSAGSSTLGTLTADGSGNLSGLLRLPFSLDTGTGNTITAIQAGGAGTAITQITGLAVIPSIAAGQQLSGHVGDVILVHALGFAPQDPLTITVGGAPTISNPGDAPPHTGDTGALDVSFTIPSGAPPGNDTLVISGAAIGVGQSDSASAPINVVGLQNLVVTPNPAPSGGTVEIRAGGFSADERVDISFSYHDSVSGGSTLANASASSDGAGNLDVSFTLPQSAAANTPATMSARGESSGLFLSQPMAVTRRPSIALVPPGGEPGTPIALSGTGFQPGERVFLNSPLFRLSSSGVVADATGVLTETFTVRALTAPGFYSVGATGINGSRAFAGFTVPKPPSPQLSVSPPTVAPGDALLIRGERFLASEPVALSLNSVPLAPAGGPITATLTGAFNTTIQVPKVSQSGVYAVTAQGLLTGSKGTSNVNLVLPPVSKTYFAEGYTGSGPSTRFGENIDLFNTSPITAEGRIEYFLSTGITSTVTVSIPAHSRLTEDVGKDVGPNQSVSAVVEVDHPTVTTRTITRTTASGTALASSISGGDAALSQFWYFADGYTGVSFQEYLSLFNPGNVPAQIMVQTFAPLGTAPVAPFSQTVPAHARITVNLRAIVPNRSIGLLVQADQPVAAERVMYWGSGSGSGKYGTSVSAGVRGPATVWNFPYVSTTNGDQVFLSFANPTTVAAHVQFALYGERGVLAPLAPTTIPPGARATVAVPVQASPADIPVAIVARSDVPVVGEESQFFGGSPNVASHAGSIISGTSSPSIGIAFSGFSSKQFASVEWYVLNTSSRTANLTATVLDAIGQTTTFQRAALPGRLTKISVGASGATSTELSTLWSSDVPVSIIQYLRGSDANSGAIATGVLLSTAPGDQTTGHT